MLDVEITLKLKKREEKKKKKRIGLAVTNPGVLCIIENSSLVSRVNRV